MTRFRFRGHAGAQRAINTLKQQAHKDAKEASEKSHAEVEEKKKKEVKEGQVNEFAFAVAGALKKAHEKKLKQEYEDMQKEKKEVKEGKEENEAREKARRDKNVKKWKQNTDRWAKWKSMKPRNVADPSSIKPGTYREKEDKPGVISRTWTYKEENINLPEKYGGDHSVRKIYMDEARSGRSLGGQAHDTSYGGGLYGSVADSPVRAAPPRPAAPRPVAKPVAAPAAAPKPAAPPVVHGGPQAPVAKPTPTGTSNVPAPSAPKAPAGDVPGQGTNVSDRFTYAKPDSGAAKPTTPAPAAAKPTPAPAQASTWLNFSKPSLANQPVTSYPPAAAAVHGLSTAPAQAVQDIQRNPVTGKSDTGLPASVPSPIAKPATIPQAPSPKPTLSIIPQGTRLSPTTAAPSDVQTSAPPVAQKPIGPSTTSQASVSAPPSRSDLGPTGGVKAVDQAVKNLGIKPMQAVTDMQRNPVTGKSDTGLPPPTPPGGLQGIFDRATKKKPLPERYEGGYSIRKIYMEGGFVPNPHMRTRPQSKEYQDALSKITKAQIEGKFKRGKSPEAKEYYKALDKERNR